MNCVVVLKSYDMDLYFSKIRTYPEEPQSRHATWTLSGQPDPYLFWFGLFPRHGKSDFRIRHWYAECQGHDIYSFFIFAENTDVPRTCQCEKTNAFNSDSTEFVRYETSLQILLNEISRYSMYCAWNSMIRSYIHFFNCNFLHPLFLTFTFKSFLSYLLFILRRAPLKTTFLWCGLPVKNKKKISLLLLFHREFPYMKFHDTARITYEIPWYVQFHCEFPYTKCHDLARITCDIPWYIQFHCEFPYTKCHDTKRITPEIARCCMKFYGMRSYPFNKIQR